MSVLMSLPDSPRAPEKTSSLLRPSGDFSSTREPQSNCHWWISWTTQQEVQRETGFQSVLKPVVPAAFSAALLVLISFMCCSPKCHSWPYCLPSVQGERQDAVPILQEEKVFSRLPTTHDQGRHGPPCLVQLPVLSCAQCPLFSVLSVLSVPYGMCGAWWRVDNWTK
jgi:hypothetical protein